MNFSTDEFGRPVSPDQPMQTRDVGIAHEREAVSGETVTFITGAAGFTGIVALDKGPVANLAGDRTGSFWRKSKNLLLASGPRTGGGVAKVTAVTETAASADVTITDEDFNLEQLFETPSGTKRALIVLRDPTNGNELMGWIGGVVATSNSYVLTIYNSPAGSTQSWVGTLADFTFSTDNTIFEIYSNENSLAWTTGTILTREVGLPDGPFDKAKFFDGMSNGDYALDYQRGLIYYKKATTGTSDTAAYNVLKAYQTASISGTVTVDSEFPAAAALADTTSNPTTTSVAAMTHVFNGTSWDRARGDITNGLDVDVTRLPASFNAGAADATTLRTVTATDDLGIVSLGVMDDWDESDRCKVNIIVGQAGITAGAGAVAANTPRMTQASDSPDVTALEKLDDAVDQTNAIFRANSKPIAASTYAPTRFADLGANATANVKASAGNVFSLWCDNENAADRYIQLHNTATTPAGGATPLYVFKVPAQSQVVIGTDFFTANGGHFTTGIAFAFSTTKDTYTAGTASEQSTIIHYV